MFRTTKARVLTFLILIAAFTAVVQFLNSQNKLGGIGSLVFMWCPALAAIIASVITRRSLKAIGWWPGKPKWLAAGWALPVFYSFVAYGFVWITGLGGFPNPRFLERAPMAMNLAPGHSPAYIIIAAFFFISIYLLIPSMISALGEEIGWRGFLVPELNNLVGFRGAAVISGVIWGTWHLPAIFSGYGAQGTPKAYQMACFSAMVISSAVIMAWLRMRSGSVWPCVIMHASHNAVIQLFFNAITADTGRTAYFIGEFGIALVIPQAALAWYFLKKPAAEAKTNVVPVEAAATLA
jgi:CAAX protease family protein